VAFCIHCGAQNASDASFCLSCGEILYCDPNHNKEKRRKWYKSRLLIGAAILVTVAIVLVVLFISRTSDLDTKTSIKPREIAAKNTDLGAPVLTIIASNSSGSYMSQGSGFLLSADGLAGSNYHVMKGAVRAVAECCNGRVFEIRAIEGADIDKDLVVFQLYDQGSSKKPQNLPSVTLGSSRDLSVGDKVIAIGSPQGLENTVSDGILSAIREYKSIRYLQITAPVSPGSSGGPVLNASGNMVGIATFQFEKGQNLNFAVDAEHLRPLMDQHFGVSLAEFQSVVRSSQRQQSSPRTRSAETATTNSDEAAAPSSS
jgi:S1-C subfamily serine protease